MKTLISNRIEGQVHCPICTHTVPAAIDLKGRRPQVAVGQKCARCGSSLDVAPVVQIPEAA